MTKSLHAVILYSEVPHIKHGKIVLVVSTTEALGMEEKGNTNSATFHLSGNNMYIGELKNQQKVTIIDSHFVLRYYNKWVSPVLAGASLSKPHTTQQTIFR